MYSPELSCLFVPRARRGGNLCHSIVAPTCKFHGTDLQFFISSIFLVFQVSNITTFDKGTVRPHTQQTVLRYSSPVSTPSPGQLAGGCQNRMNGRRVGVYFQSRDCGRLGKLVGNKPFKSNSPRAAFDLFRTELKPSPFPLVSRLLRGRRGIL